MLTLSNNDLQLMNVLESKTGAMAKDVITTADSVIFVVEKGQAGKVIGKKGATINGLSHLLNKKIEVFENSDTIDSFLASFFSPAIIKDLKKNSNDGKTNITIQMDPATKGLAIGRHGDRIKKARMIAKRLFQIDEIKVI